jgi:hypothetical protein
MFVLLIFGLPYSFALVVLYPCTSAFDYTIELCSGACYELDPFWGTIDWVITAIGPLCIVIVSNLVLIARVFLQKRRMLQKQVWRKNLGMLVQLLSITALHCVAWLPVCIVGVISLVQVPPPQVVQELQANWTLISLIYLAVLGCPLMCIVALPELKEKVRLCINYRRQHPADGRIHPMAMITRVANPQ